VPSQDKRKQQQLHANLVSKCHNFFEKNLEQNAKNVNLNSQPRHAGIKKQKIERP
jgi:hypothetical protein